MEDNFSTTCNPEDISSFSNFQEFKQVHIHINNNIDFENSKLLGFSEIKFVNLIPEENKNKKRIILDCKNLIIFEVENSTTGKKLNWSIYKNHEAADALGTPLVIELDKNEFKLNEEFVLKINYSTTKESDAVQWLNSNQTNLKQYPFMFTQCQAILARTLLPCQDTPSSKATVSVELTCPSHLTFAFSGTFDKSETNQQTNEITYFYKQRIPIPTYLIAFACGDLEYGKISERCGIYTERGLLDKALFEFAETEKFLKTAEDYINPYVWEVYNILVLPFAFPYGGMENPCLTFVTPALLAGDRSLTNVIAHEIAHSWTGNLVTNKDWTNFWMNEGFTTFLERKISELINGEDIANLEAVVGIVNLEQAINSIGRDHTFTSLMPDLKNVDPDDAFSVVPYEKGFCLLKFLEKLIGKENFQTIFRDYIIRFTNKSITYEDYIGVFEEHVQKIYGQQAEEILKKIDWNKWIFSKGDLIEKVEFKTKWIEIANNLAELFLKGDSTAITDKEVNDFKSWHTNVKIVFIDYLDKNQGRISDSVYEIIRDKLGLHSDYNVEVSFSWYQICLDLKKTDAIEHIKKFLLCNGRMKYIKPLYFKYYSYNREEALAFFKENKHIYHTVAARLIQRRYDELEAGNK